MPKSALKIFLVISPFLAIVSIGGCNTIKSNNEQLKLIGGVEISEDQWPSVRKLKIFEKISDGTFSLRSTCTITFIKPNLALTAGHCLCHGQKFVYEEKERWEDFVAKKHVIHPKYDCKATTPNAYDIALVWFDKKVAMPTSNILDLNANENLGRLRLIGYGDNILKMSGSFWLGNRRAISSSTKPSERKGNIEFDGKRIGEVTWNGEKPQDFGFIRLTATYDFRSKIDALPTTVSSAEGDSGGPAVTMQRNEILAIISRGSFRFTGTGSERVEAITEMIDLRRPEIRYFLSQHEALSPPGH
jgi:hypothetical protein